MTEMKQDDIKRAKIKVVGVGGGGGNAVNRMIEDGFTGVEFIVVNTDHQVLKDSKAEKVLIGQKVTRGLGAGANPEVGKKAAEENKEEIKKMLEGADLVFISAGMGGGTGTGAAPVVAEIARELDVLTIGIITLPFNFEGRSRMRKALKGKKEFSKNVDTLITIPNENILKSLSEKEAAEISFESAFKLADSVLSKATRGVTSLINDRGHVNLDFADIRTVVRFGGSALIGMGSAQGENAAEKATMEAMTSPLLMHGMTGAKGVVMNFKSARSYPFLKISSAANMVEEQADPEAEVLFGHVIAEEEDWEEDRVEVTIVATGFPDEDTVYDQNTIEQKRLEEELLMPKNKLDFVSDSPSKTVASIKDLEKEYEDDEIDIPFFLRGNGTRNR